MTLYKFPSGKIVSDEDYKATFAEEYPSDRPEAAPDYVPPSNDGNKQVVFDENDEEDEE
jgi:hypothetical protein